MAAKLKIIEEPNVIDDHLLDIIGNEFRFDHEKGLAEWLKNSVDAYRSGDIPDSEQHVILRFFDGVKNNAVFECVDFVGMTERDIEKAFKRWGDPEAAKRGMKGRLTYGGHGNGGKFYMRQMFEQSYFITFRGGHLSIFGFAENRKYGFAKDFKNKKVGPEEALEIAGVKQLIFPENLKKKVLGGEAGFTVVRGIGPHGMKNKVKVERILDRFRNHPQSRRILSHVSVWYSHNNSREYSLLKPDEISPLPGFENARILEIPETISIEEDGEKIPVQMFSKTFPAGKLVLKTSAESFGQGTRSSELNRIDILGKIGVIGSYQLYKLGVTTFPQAAFIYGECECPILEDPEMDSVKNDRAELVENPRSKALLGWIRKSIDDLATEISAKERSEQEASKKEISEAFNEFLNKWKDQFMSRIMGDLFKTGGETGNGASDGQRGSALELPENGFAFSFPRLEISLDVEEKITLKAQVPNPIPMGSIMTFSAPMKRSN
jgi:hypothetical protein